MKFCEMLEAPFTPSLAKPGPGGKDATLYGRPDARRHGHCKNLGCAPAAAKGLPRLLGHNMLAPGNTATAGPDSRPGSSC